MSRRTLKLVEKNKRRKRNRIIIKVILFTLIVSLALFVALYFRTKSIRVNGNETYTEEEVIKSVKSKRYIGNTLLMMIKSKFLEEDYLPFIDYTYFSFANSHILDVKVKELPRAGAFKQGNFYMYFNYSGIVVEKKKKLFDGVPLLEDIKMGKAKINQSIPVADDVKHAIVSTTKNLAQKDVAISSLSIDKKGQITLKSGEYVILLGDVSCIEAKVAKIPEVLSAISKEYSSGTIDMTLYTDEQEIITYHK